MILAAVNIKHSHGWLIGIGGWGGTHPLHSVWGVIKLCALHSLEEDVSGTIHGYQDLFTPHKKRSSTLNKKTCISQFGSNHTGFSFIVCTTTTLRIAVSLFPLQTGKKKQQDYPPQITTFLVSLFPFFSPKFLSSFLLTQRTPTSQNLQQHICPQEV